MDCHLIYLFHPGAMDVPSSGEFNTQTMTQRIKTSPITQTWSVSRQVASSNLS